MGVSFKISKKGSRFRQKPLLLEPTTAISDVAAAAENSAESSRILAKNESHASTTTASSAHKLDGRDEDTAGFSGSSLSSGRRNISSEGEISFIVNLYPDGYNITKLVENENGNRVLLQDDVKLLHPYDRNSESLLSAIESGHLPGDLLDDIQCNFVDGGLICEVRDYRTCAPESGSGAMTMDGSPMTTKVHLKMSLENVVKDILLIADDSWTYGDFMEVESRILKVLQPKLLLDPTPRLDRLSDSRASSKLNLGLSAMRKRRPEIVVTTSKLHAKRICMGRVPETSGYKLGEAGPVSGDVMSQPSQENPDAQNIVSSNMVSSRSRSFVQDVASSNLASQQSKLHVGVEAGNQRATQDHMASMISASGTSPSVQDVMPYNDNLNSTSLLPGKMETQDGQLPSLSTVNKRARIGMDGAQQQQLESYMDSLQGSDVPWRNSLARGIQYLNTGGQKYSHLVREAVSSQDIVTSVAMGQLGMRPSANVEHIGTEKLDNSEVGRNKNDMQMILESEGMDPRFQQRIPQNSVLRSGLLSSWNNLSQQVEKDPRKEDSFQKRKSVQSPRVSAGNLVQSPLPTKSTEFPGVSVGNHYGVVSSTAPPVLPHRDKPGTTSISSVPRPQSVTSSANDSMQQQHQVQVGGKRRSNSLPKPQANSGVGSPVSVGNASVPMNAASPSVATPQLVDHMMLDKFSKIEMITSRLQLNHRKNKVDEFLRKPRSFPSQQITACLSSLATNDNIEDDGAKSLSKSLLGGSVNSCKIRVLNFVQAERTPQGSTIPAASRVRTRMIMSEKPNDGIIAMHYGEVEDGDYLKAEDHLPTLPNSHVADLLAAQFQSLMCREGYYVEYDHVQTRPQNIPASSQLNAPVNPSNNSAVDMQQYSEPLSGSQLSEVTNPAMSGNPTVNSPMNMLSNSGMLPPGNQQGLQISQVLRPNVTARPQQLDPQQPLQQQQQQQQQLPPQNQQSLVQQSTQIPRSPLMMPPSSLSQLNAFGQNPSLQIGNQMVGKPSMQLLQQQSHIQQPQIPRKMVMGGLGTPIGMGSLGNGVVNLGGLGSVMGIGAGRGMGGTGISAPTGPIPGMGNLGQTTFSSIGQAIRSGTLSPAHAQAAMLATRMNFANRGMLPGPQSVIASLSGVRQMQPGAPGRSMLGPTMNRGNISTMRTTMGAMAAPKLMTGAGMNVHLSQQQLQQQPHQIQQQQHHQQQQQQLQQQEIPPLRVAVSPPQVSSPSTMGIPQPLNQPLPQQVSPQISSGTMHPMSGGNPEAGPASPQLSSQTLGSVGSITNSSLDMQGVNKSNSMSNS